MTEKRLFLSLFVVFFASVALLFWLNDRGLDPDQGKSWWSLAFKEPEMTQSLRFIVINHTDDSSFRYRIDADGTVLSEGEFTLERSATQHEAPRVEVTPGKRYTITVIHGSDTKTIYHSL